MENITIFAVIIRANILFGILGASPKEYYSMEILDKTDLQILRVLQNNSRLTTKELAAKVNLSPTPVFERVKRLEANGYIKKYVAVLDPTKLNRGFVVFCSVKLRRLNRDIAAEFTRIVREIPEVAKETFEPVSSVSGLFVSKQEEALPKDQPDKPVGESEEKQACEVDISEAEGPVKSQTVLAVKNNLLYDLALAPNIEVEIPIGKRWSLNTEYKCPWWLNSKHDFCYQLLSGGMEGRFWLGNRQKRDRLIGHFIGLYAEGGIYDFQLRGDGYQGKYYGAAGVIYGYARQLARHFSLEFSLGIGYLTTEYKKYTPYEGDIIWTNSGRYNFIGPTKAKISLVWLITTRR